MDHDEQPQHFLIVAVPAQSHLNPAFQLALRLISSGALVTLATTVSASKRITAAASSSNNNSRCLVGQLRWATFSDGYDDGYNGSVRNALGYTESLRRRGTETLSELIEGTREPKIDYVVYTIILSWVGEVARRYHLPSALLWVQPATTFYIFHCYFKGGYADVIESAWNDNDNHNHNHNDEEVGYQGWVKLPGLPPLTADDLPTFLCPSSLDSTALPMFREQFEELERQPPARRTVLINTHDALEVEPLKALLDIGRYQIITVGPLLDRRAILLSNIATNHHLHLDHDLDPEDESLNNNNNNNIGWGPVDMFKRTEEDYLKWLDSKEDSSVVYASFGSISVLSTRQVEELARGLVECGRPFLWAIKPYNSSNNTSIGISSDKGHLLDTAAAARARAPAPAPAPADEMISEIIKEKPEEKEEGHERRCLVVPWCSQVEVLSHKAVGCFVTHCGWNSSLETLSFGVPVVGMPQWNDQTTNAKMLQDFWKVGLTAKPSTTKPTSVVLLDQQQEFEELGTATSSAVVESQEIRRCIEAVINDDQMRANARLWKFLASQAVKKGGSSEINLTHFRFEPVTTNCLT